MQTNPTAHAIDLYMKACDLNLDDMAALCGVSRQAVHHWRTGRNAPGIAMIQQWIASTDVTLATLGRTVAKIQYPTFTAIGEKA